MHVTALIIGISKLELNSQNFGGSWNPLIRPLNTALVMGINCINCNYDILYKVCTVSSDFHNNFVAVTKRKQNSELNLYRN